MHIGFGNISVFTHAFVPCIVSLVTPFFFLFNSTKKKRTLEKAVYGSLRTLTLYVKTAYKQLYATFLVYRKVLCLCNLYRGGSRIFFRRGCTRLLLYFSTNKPHRFFFGRIPVVLDNRSPSRGGGGGGAHPRHPPPRSAPALWAALLVQLYEPLHDSVKVRKCLPLNFTEL